MRAFLLTALCLATLVVSQSSSQTTAINQNECRLLGDSKGLTLFVVASDAGDCQCQENAWIAQNSRYRKCPPPTNGETHGYAGCEGRNGVSKCTVVCTKDAGDIPNSNGECIPLNLGEDPPFADKPQEDCEAPLFDGSDSDAPYLIAHDNFGCSCSGTPPQYPQPSFKHCVGPPNSKVFCRVQQTCQGANCVNIPGTAQCNFNCTQPDTIRQGGACVPDSTRQTPPSTTICDNPDLPLTFAYTDKTCSCREDTYDGDDGDGSPGSECANPVGGNGKGRCRDTGTSSSECYIECFKDFELQNGKCVATRAAATLTPGQCAHPPPGGYLTADPALGCRCSPTRPQNPLEWCRAPRGGTTSCVQTPNPWKVECRSKCPAKKTLQNSVCVCEKQFVAQGNDCVCPQGTTLQPDGSCLDDVIVVEIASCNDKETVVFDMGSPGCRCITWKEAGSKYPGLMGTNVCNQTGKCTSKRDRSNAKCI